MNTVLTIDYLDELIRKLSDSINSSPAGAIVVSNSCGRTHMYINNKYVNKKQISTIVKYAQKKYEILLLKTAQHIRKQISTKSCTYYLNDLGLVYENFSASLKPYVKPYEVSDNLYAENWEKEKYAGNPFAEENLVFETEKGHKVRSKSEVLIANKLFLMKIPYKYECPLTLPNGKTIYPDFQILNKKTREVLIIEHFGMLDNSEYRDHFFKKLDSYSQLGTIAPKKLIMFFEDGRHPLNLRIVEQTLKEVCKD